MVIAGIGNRMMEEIHSTNHRQEPHRVPQARYAYYRRCQLFRRNGEQCKAPAEKGAAICHAHAAQQAMAFRRDLERRIVLAEAVAEMRRQGKPECELADLFTDFKGIQVTLAVMSRALIQGRIDCKTAGRLVVHLQTISKLLWQIHRKGRKGNQELPQICADERRLKNKIVPLINTDNADLNKHKNLMEAEERSMSGIHGEELRAAVDRNIRAFPEESRNMQHGKWEQTRAA
jgi:hypothetical protein